MKNLVFFGFGVYIMVMRLSMGSVYLYFDME